MGAALHWKWFVKEKSGGASHQGEDDDADADYAYPSLVSHVTWSGWKLLDCMPACILKPHMPCTCNELSLGISFAECV